MNELRDQLREDFQNEDARYAYAEGFLNASIAAQIKTLRGEMSQQDLADKVGTKQSGISRLENVGYSAWKVETLRKLARAFGLRLRISFEEFGTLIPEIENFRKGTLQRRRFQDDPVFEEQAVKEPETEEGAVAPIAHSGILKGLGLRAGEYFPESDLIRRAMERAVERVQSYAQPGIAGLGLQGISGVVKPDIPALEAADEAKIALVVNIDLWRQGALESNPSPKTSPAATRPLNKHYTPLQKPA